MDCLPKAYPLVAPPSSNVADFLQPPCRRQVGQAPPISKLNMHGQLIKIKVAEAYRLPQNILLDLLSLWTGEGHSSRQEMGQAPPISKLNMLNWRPITTKVAETHRLLQRVLQDLLSLWTEEGHLSRWEMGEAAPISKLKMHGQKLITIKAGESYCVWLKNLPQRTVGHPAWRPLELPIGRLFPSPRVEIDPPQ